MANSRFPMKLANDTNFRRNGVSYVTIKEHPPGLVSISLGLLKVFAFLLPATVRYCSSI